jgi:hypothetical protein
VRSAAGCGVARPDEWPGRHMLRPIATGRSRSRALSAYAFSAQDLIWLFRRVNGFRPAWRAYLMGQADFPVDCALPVAVSEGPEPDSKAY